MFHKMFFGAVGSGLLAVATVAQGASIGVNFTGGGNGSSPAVSMLAGDSAGVVPQTNFNNVPGQSGTSLALIDNTGAATAATLTFTSSGTYSSIGGAGIVPAGGDEKLNTGFVYGNGTFTISGIPYANYDVIVYALNDAAGRVQTTTLGATNFYNSPPNPGDAGHVDQNAGTAYQYVQAVSTDSANPTANADYVRFTGLSGNSVTFTDAAPGNGYVNGFQIVQTPEPATAALLGIGSLTVLARRRRRA